MTKNNRLLLVDALRGFALLMIILIHSVEHFEFFRAPEYNFLFSGETDGKVMRIVFAMISGKAYSIFALLFGLSFFIQMDRNAQKGIDFRAGFLWRISILLFMGFVHSLVYRGDILHIYALLALPLPFLYRVNTKVLMGICILLVAQIPMVYHLVQSFADPEYRYIQSIPRYWQEGNEAYATGNLYDVMSYNLWKGRISVWAWTIYNGRYLQLFALFILGLVLGRIRLFENLKAYKKATAGVLIASILVFTGIYLCRRFLIDPDFSNLQKNLLGKLLASYSAFTVTLAIVSSLILIYLKTEDAKFFRVLSYYGRMSLSNYVFQSLLGVLIFYGFGLALYKYMGSTWSVLFGILLFTIQVMISKYWIQRYYYGPLEWLWRSLTYLDFKTKFKRTTEDKKELAFVQVQSDSKR